ncbi:RNA polymerase factor sigma-32 [Methylocystis heyeri]|uniref:Sigma-70 family RNA polymerase sigma factor n=1 Tax=Methylocystis heyeri TaxID=391905 RepID=A0A6B8KCA4_9HYPH|nr:RNA polymerase factor sigma-32 [Methylocystis heyeri]QGM46054.1 sigma-70 family RNA polymerase sigma factor [Methylocystis heyeri]
MSMTLPMLRPENGLTRYLLRIRQLPMLEFLEEQILARRWREHEDSRAANELIASHLRLVVKIAFGYRGYGLPVSELISEGNFGLMQAVKRFEPERDVRLSTYAPGWIRASIQEYVLRSWSLVRTGSSSNMKKLLLNLRYAKSRLSAYEEGDLRLEDVAMIAIRLGVRQKDVIEMNRRIGGDNTLNALIAKEDEGGVEWQDWPVDACDDQETVLVDHEEGGNRQMTLRTALEVLNPRERRILEARRLTDNPVTLTALAAEFGVSRERIRQIEVHALGKVQREVRAGVAHIDERAAEAHAMWFVIIEDAQGEHTRTQRRLRH